VKSGNLWRSRYDDLLIENRKLRESNKILKNQLYVTIGVALVIFIYEIIKNEI
jgi:hypothetical protein